MTNFTFALYDAFSDRAFGGSQAGIVFDNDSLDGDTRLKIAREFGWPATCFVNSSNSESISARFYSTIREYPMCGHGTVCLMTMMIDNGILNWDKDGKIFVKLDLSQTQTAVEISRLENGRALIMLDVEIPVHRPAEVDLDKLMELLGANFDCLAEGLPVETVAGSFTHLVMPIGSLDQMKHINPDFEGLRDYCNMFGIDTIAAFCIEVEFAGNNFHVRDFCPAVGVPESAAAGTTNGALTSYLVKHRLFYDAGSGKIELTSEQGLEMGRPSTLYSIACLRNGEVERLQVGGVATKIIEGQLSYEDQLC
jgi:trans-2,3-dihydro-3-hydroxyanthranilate isomerase